MHKPAVMTLRLQDNCYGGYYTEFTSTVSRGRSVHIG
jgi:hypothetical protein